MKNIYESKQNITFTLFKAKLPKSVYGVTQLDKRDGSIIVAINTDATEDEQAAAFLHEMLHIYHGDIYKDDTTAVAIEAERQAEFKRLLSLESNFHAL